MRLKLLFLSFAFALSAACVPAARGEYFNLRSGARIHATSYQLVGDGDRYRLQLTGGFVVVAASEVLSIDPEEIFTSIPNQPPPPAPLAEIIKAASAKYSVDADLINSVIAAESNFDPKAVSKRNACGLMQLLPETAERFGIKNIFDPQENIDAGTHYLSDLLKLYGNDLVLTLAAYNAGPQRVQQFGNVPPYRETVSYIRRVKRNYAKSKAGLTLDPAPDPARNASPTSAQAPTGAQKKPAQAPPNNPASAGPSTTSSASPPAPTSFPN